MGYLRFLIPFLLFFQVGCMRHYRSSHLSVYPQSGRRSGDGLGVHTRSVESISLHTRGIHKQLREGEDIELPCTVIGDGYNPFTNPIVWHKVVGKTEMQINTASIIASPFLDTKRYTLNHEMNTSPMKVNLGLVLTGVTLAESGTYRCEVLAPPDRVLGNVTHTITVAAPIESFTFSSNNTQPLANPNNSTRHQMTFDFVELMPSYVGCVAKGGHPKPTLRVYHEKKDITKDFDYEETNVTSGVPGLEVTSYSMSLTNAEYSAPVTSRGQHLRCVAKIHKASDLKRTQIALIEVKYGPRFECDESSRAWPGDVNVTLTCRLTSNPVVELPSVRWRFSVPAVNETEEEVVLVTGEQARDGLYTIHTEMSAEGEVVTTLTIQNVTSDTFNTYRLEAENEVSNGHGQVVLSEAFTTTEPTTQEVTTQEVTTRPPKDTILPEGDGNNKPAAAVTGTANSLQSSALGTLRVVMLVLLVCSGVQSIF